MQINMDLSALQYASHLERKWSDAKSSTFIPRGSQITLPFQALNNQLYYTQSMPHKFTFHA